MENQQYQPNLLLCQFCRVPAQESSLQNVKGRSTFRKSNSQSQQTFVSKLNPDNICKRCGSQLIEQQNRDQHRKRQYMRPNSFNSIVIQEIVQDESNSMLFSEQQITNSAQLMKSTSQISQSKEQINFSELFDIAISTLTPFARSWLKENQNISSPVLLAHFKLELQSFITFFSRKIIKPTWNMFKNIGKHLDWVQFLERPQNIFNQKYIDRKLTNLSHKKQVQYIKGINQLSHMHKGLLKMRTIPLIRNQNKTKELVKIVDIVLLIERLLTSNKRTIVHLGIDFYIILLVSKNYFTNHQQIQHEILRIMKQNQNRQQSELQSDLILSFNLRSEKPGCEKQILLNKQLILLLINFGWQGFHPKTSRIVKRMNQWLGVTALSFKYSILDITIHNSKKKRKKNCQSLTKLSGLAAHEDIINKIVIPNLDDRYGKYNRESVLNYYQSLTDELKSYQQFRVNWFQELLKRLYTKKYEYQFKNDVSYKCGYHLNFHSSENLNLNDQIEQAYQQTNRQFRQDKSFEQSQRGQVNQCQVIKDQKDTIVIYGEYYSYNENKFDKMDFFEQVYAFTDDQCSVCKSKIKAKTARLKCLLCSCYSHHQCSRCTCNCIYESQHFQLPKITSLDSSIKRDYISIIMPSSYYENNKDDQEHIIQVLAARKFRYTRSAVISRSMKIPKDYYKRLKQIKINRFEDYLNRKYFPPIQIRPIADFQNYSIFGQQFGIFAVKDIDERVLIGEYSCDLLFSKDLVLCKKPDSIMIYSEIDSKNSIYLAPKDFSGYVPLINTATNEQYNNCACIRAIIHGAVRVIIYTKRRISSGEQLLYEYGSKYKFADKY